MLTLVLSIQLVERFYDPQAGQIIVRPISDDYQSKKKLGW